MTDATAAFRDVNLYDGRALPLAELRRAVLALGRTAVVGLGGVVAVGAMVTTVTVTAAWIVTTVVSSNPNHQAMSPARLGAIDVANLSAGSIGATRFNNAMNFEAKWSLAMALSSTPNGLDAGPQQLDRIAEGSPALPQSQVPPIEAAPDIARASASIEIAELPPIAEVVAVPVPMPPAKPVLEQADITPLPRPYPVKREIARIPDEQATPAVTKPAVIKPALIKPPAPQIAALTPPATPRAEKRTTLPGVDSRTAVYDISAHTVFLPNGERLEAHSGLGDKLDDPRYIHVKNRGPTPPNIYNLKLREALFHGVQAIRLNPVDESAMFGRDGMLAHTYMLGPNGQSNGCVSFRDYERFLRAVVRGDVDRLVVVTHLANTPWRTAAATTTNDDDSRFGENIIP